MNRKAIGVFDSGIGGLTVVRALMERLPFEDIVYFGDTARVPYGVKSQATIYEFTQQITRFLLEREVKMLIIACNTIAAVAAEKVATWANVPVLDVIEAGAAAAVQQSKTKHIGVIATPTTVNSNAYARAISRHLPQARIFSQACPLFVPLVEEGWLEHEVTRLTALEYLRPVLAEDVDTLVLGCTHYPLLKPLISKVCGEAVSIVDSAVTTAEWTAQRLEALNLLTPSQGQMPNYQFFVTDIPLRFQTIGERFLGRSIQNLEMVRLDG